MNIKNMLEGNITQAELLNYLNANITYKELPNGLNGFVFSYRGIGNIIINSKLAAYKKRKTILHELAHIELNHLNRVDNDLLAFKLEKYEDDADVYIKFLGGV